MTNDKAMPTDRRGTMNRETISAYTLLFILLASTLPHGIAHSYEVFVVGEKGTCYKSDGDEWHRVSGMLSRNTHRFWALSEDNIYATAGATTAGVNVYNFDGVSWNTFYTAPEHVWVGPIWCASDTDIFLGGCNNVSEGVILHYDGVEWTETSYPSTGYIAFRSISGSSASDVYAVNQKIFIHFDGSGWSEVDLGDWGEEDLNWNAVWCNSPNDVYVAGYYYYNGVTHTCIILHYDGSGWSEAYANDNLELTSLWMSDEGVLYASGQTRIFPIQGKVVRYDGNWQVATFPKAHRLHSIHGNSSADVYVVGESSTQLNHGIVYHYDGGNWDLAQDKMDQEIFSVHCVTEDFAVAGGEFGYVFRGSGLDWMRWMPEVTADFVDVWGTSMSDLYAVSADGSIHRNDGISWNEISGPGYPVEKIWGLSANEIYAVGEQGVFRYNGISWSRIFDEPANDIWGTSSTNLYVTNDRPNSYVRHYDGVEWTYVSTYPYYFMNLGVWGTTDDELFLVGDYEECDDPQMLCWFVPFFLHRDEAGWECLNGDIIWEINYYEYDVWGSSGDYVFSVGPQDTRLFDGETQAVIGPGGVSVWSSGIEAWWTNNDYWEGESYVAHFDGFQTSTIYLNDCELNGVWGIGEPCSTVMVTVTTDPPGLEITVAGATYSSPHTFPSLSGTEIEIGAISPQIMGDDTYTFVEWSDGGDTTHVVTFPDSNVTYTAIFTDVITGDELDPVPLVNSLHQNHPNPFNPSTTISFSLRERSRATLAVYDVTGRLVRVLIDEVREAGPHDVTWDGRNRDGSAVTSGVYFYRLEAGEFVETKKMVLLR
jgi:hypothetical protein